ncbi:hypothetical protein [Paenibacillus sp. CH40]|uniref:hypothetical protein n=1 Tax=Paenibacillus sp. CH40 TaxID=2962045 RepID=UPI0020B659DA|nr:hypothetical protein [Paenibacillus sp. CH40]MCP3795748.1 hypothetical protein [Paenibacillus sp. CH40]
MASEKTPNLGLNQIDRTSPKTTYFDLEKYLDQNWRAVDDFAGDVNDGVNEIKKRLDTTERKAVTLEPGGQIVHAEKAAPFSLTGLSGRTLVNLLGRMGSCETVSEWSSNVAIAIDNNNKTNGSSSFKITLGSVPATASASFLTTPGRKYIAIADVKRGNTSKVAISINGIASVVGNEVSSGSVFAPSVVRFTAKEYFHIVTITGTGAADNIFNMDSVRVYEISEADYADAASLTPAQAAAKYPYVDSVMPVRNPYAIRYGENLLPNFYEWTKTGHTVFISDAYTTSGTLVSGDIGTDAYMVYYLDAVPNLEYTLTNPADSNGFMRISTFDKNAVRLQGMFVKPGESKTIKLSPSAVRMGINISGVTSYTDEFDTNQWIWSAGTVRNFKKPMLNIGSTAKPFKPREDSMLALQTDLYADPVTGANADTVFERDGQYFKSKKWQGLTLDGNLAWIYFESGTGYKVVRIPVTNGVVDSERITKFDGKLVQHVFPLSGPDQSHLSPESGIVGLSISVADSGWADSYTPTLDDIKAYFFGYKAYDANTITPANAQAMTTATWSGTGTKYWVQRVGAANFTQSVPTTSYTGYTSYQLVYQLATPTVEPIVSEGQLTFNEGDNQVEVGTGLIVRESVKPSQSSVQYWVNGNLDGLGKLRERTSKIVAVYRNGKNDSWGIIGHAEDAKSIYGLYQAYAPSNRFDQTALYSATYLIFETSPVAPFLGTYAANEKTLLADLMDSVQKNTARVSVLENKKADKDNPAVLTPTLLNGVTLEYPTSPVEYRKSSDGLVTIQGSVKPSSTGDVVAFMLPVGYRPKQTVAVALAGNTGTSDIMVRGVVLSGGQVQIGNSVPVIWVRLDGIQFIAER